MRYLVQQTNREPPRAEHVVAGGFERVTCRLPKATLTRYFGYFLVVMGVVILLRSAPEALNFFS